VKLLGEIDQTPPLYGFAVLQESHGIDDPARRLYGKPGQQNVVQTAME
jgi:hypothetical protein